MYAGKIRKRLTWKHSSVNRNIPYTTGFNEFDPLSWAIGKKEND